VIVVYALTSGESVDSFYKGVMLKS